MTAWQRALVRGAIALGAALFASACGSRSGLYSTSDLAGGSGGQGGTGAGGQGCSLPGQACSGTSDCCSTVCSSGKCAEPPSPCNDDVAPVLLITELQDPYSLGGDATWLYMGQLEKDRPLLRLPKVGGSLEVLAAPLNYVDFLTVRENMVFFSDEGAVKTLSTDGSSPTVLATAFGPTGFAVTPDKVYLAEYLAKQLVEIDRTTGAKNVLAKGFDGIYRVAVLGSDVYFSDFNDGLHGYHLTTGVLSLVGAGLGDARAVRAAGDSVYYTVASKGQIYRVSTKFPKPDLVADLSSLGPFIEALEADEKYLYTTVSKPGGQGAIVRVPHGGGMGQVVTFTKGPDPSALVVDGECVYWTERASGSIFRAKKTPIVQP